MTGATGAATAGGGAGWLHPAVTTVITNSIDKPSIDLDMVAP
jgi:hypothetical protein